MASFIYITFFIFLMINLLQGGIDHRKCLVFGTLYYFLTPFIVGEYFNSLNIPSFDKWFLVYSEVTLEQKLLFLFNALMILFSYHLGSTCAYRTVNRKKYYTSKYIFESASLGRAGGVIISSILIIFTALIWMSANSLFFKGYSGEYNTDIMGRMATLNLLLLVTAFFVNGFAKKTLLFLLCINSVFLLSMGGRMYIITSVLFVLFYFFDKQKIPKHLLLLIFSLCTLLVAVGMLRVNNNDGLGGFLYMGLAEPVFTSFSAITFLLIPENFNLMSFPSNFVSSFLMLAPNILNYKESINIGIESMGYVFSSPLGATSVFTSLSANFGILGTYFYLFFLGFTISKIQYSPKIYFRCMYLMSCAVLPFMFYRDGFGIVNKVIFFTGLIIPWMYVMFSKLLISLRGR